MEMAVQRSITEGAAPVATSPVSAAKIEARREAYAAGSDT